MPRLIAGTPGKRKFWHAWADGTELTVRFGKMGTTGQEQTKSFDTAEAAAKELAKLVKQKLAKGYADAARTSSFDESGLTLVEVVDLPPRPEDASVAYDAAGLGEGSWSGPFWLGDVTFGLKKKGTGYTAGLINRSGDAMTWRPFAPPIIGTSFANAFDSRGKRFIVAVGSVASVIDCDTLARTNVTTDGDAIEAVALLTEYAVLLRKQGQATRLELYTLANHAWSLVRTIACHRQTTLSALAGGKALIVGWENNDNAWDGKAWPTTHYLGIDSGEIRSLGSNGMSIDYAFELDGRSLFASASFGLLELKNVDEAIQRVKANDTPTALG